jgi:hypothetical protein
MLRQEMPDPIRPRTVHSTAIPDVDGISLDW